MSADVVIRSLHPRLRPSARAVARAVGVLDGHHGRLRARKAPPLAGELSVVFLTDAALARLHGNFLADPSATDVITFPGQAALGTAGEICLSVDAAVRAARARGRKFGDELALYLVHGWLHLAGHRDTRPAERRAMRRAEARALRTLRAADAMPGFVLKP